MTTVHTTTGGNMKRIVISALAMALACTAASAAEVTIRNDGLNDFGSAAIVWGFVPGEKAASWLTSPCDGTLRAVQIFWRSPTGTAAQQIHSAIEIFRSGTFPNPGELAETIAGPVLQDGALNEWRHLDENGLIPLAVPVTQDETFVVSFTFDTQPLPNLDPSITRDADGIQSHRNALYARLSSGTSMWMDSSALGLTGDWVIRAVVDCDAVSNSADVSVSMNANLNAYIAGQPLTYTAVVSNDGPGNASNVSIVDIFPPAFTNPSWTCTATAGASCPASGNGHITHAVNLPSGGSVTYEITGTVAASASGSLTNSLTAAVTGIDDPDPANNTATLTLEPETDGPDDFIFADGFEEPSGSP